MRILHCVAGLGRGGYETFLMNVYRKIDRTRIQFDFLYSFDGVYTDEVKQLGGKLYKIPFITQKGPFTYRKNVLAFFKAHPEYKIVHSHMDKFSGEIMQCAHKCGIPVRIAHSHNIKNEGGRLFQLVKNYYGKKIIPHATHHMACSMDAYEWLFGTKENALIIKNAIDSTKFICEDQRNPSNFTIVHVGRFTPQKNHIFLIDIFKELCQMEATSHLILAGTGALQASIRDKVKQLKLEKAVTFLDDCNDVPALLNTADAFCMPSLFEGLGIVLIEAQAAGVPCVIADTIPAEVDITGDVSFLSLQDSPQKWAETLLRYKGRPKADNRQKVIDSGYDIASTTSYLQHFYMENWPD